MNKQPRKLKVDNMRDLRDALIENLKLIVDKQIDLPSANQFTKAAGRIVYTAKVELDYNKAMKYEGRKIKFLEVED